MDPCCPDSLEELSLPDSNFPRMYNLMAIFITQLLLINTNVQ